MKPFIQQFTATDDWVSLADLYDDSVGNELGTTTVINFKGTVTAHQDNGDVINIRVGAPAEFNEILELELVAKEYFDLDACNIAGIEIKGEGLVLKFFGNTVAKGW